jgi:hypothetical protein
LILYLNFSGLYTADKNEGTPLSSSPSSLLPGKAGNEFRFYNLSFFRLASKKKAMRVALLKLFNDSGHEFSRRKSLGSIGLR